MEKLTKCPVLRLALATYRSVFRTEDLEDFDEAYEQICLWEHAFETHVPEISWRELRGK